MRMLAKCLGCLVLALGFSAWSYAEALRPEAVGLAPDAPAYARHGPCWVGIQEQVFRAHGVGGSDYLAYLWYPALNARGEEEDKYYLGLFDAPPDPSAAPYPLVVFVPNWHNGLENFRYFCAHLASHGFVVVAIDCPSAYPPSYVQQTIDFAARLNAADAPLAGMIDPSRTAVAGHDVGGRVTAQMAGVRIVQLGNRSDLPVKDERVKAVVISAPSLYRVSTCDFSAVKAPLLLLQADLDVGFTLADGWRAYREASTVNKCLIVFLSSNIDYFPYSPYSTTLRLDLRGPRRADLINHFTTAFLLETLKGDLEARQALLPDAVNFPGVRYTTALK